MAKLGQRGWDLGGAECPADPENLTVVDIVTHQEAKQYNPDVEFAYKQVDLTQPEWGLEPRQELYMGATLRYLGGDEGGSADINPFWDGAPPDVVPLYEQLASNLYKSCTSGGTLTIRDIAQLVCCFGSYLELAGFKTTKMDLAYNAGELEATYTKT